MQSGLFKLVFRVEEGSQTMNNYKKNSSHSECLMPVCECGSGLDIGCPVVSKSLWRDFTIILSQLARTSLEIEMSLSHWCGEFQSLGGLTRSRLNRGAGMERGFELK